MIGMVVSETINVLCPNQTMSGVDMDRERNRDRNRYGGSPVAGSCIKMSAS